HTKFGRKNNRRLPIDTYKYFRENYIMLSAAKDKTPEELAGKIICGEFVNRDTPEYTEQYKKLVIDKAQGGE
ncbi:MAG: 2-oxoacid:ferredoxin oxidoreductase subunit beta, partial [Synergistaceae bacterium]|nr:2-oxoacid:ferredoxin oxidoreductase subunit beta [Synergistaceae bacterium]